MKKILMIVCLMIAAKGMAASLSTVELKIVDEAGAPIAGVEAVIIFNGEERTKYEGVTGTNGLFSAQGKIPALVGYGGQKEGYYRSTENFKFLPDRNAPGSRIEKRTLTMRKIIEPKEGKKAGTRGVVPKLDEPLGFDILAGDWVSPYGKGVVADFVFTCANDTTNQMASYVLTFPNTGDGIIEYPRDKKGQSIFRWPYKAPLDGYLSVLKNKEIYAFDKNTTIMSDYKTLPQEPSDIQYIFRIRTKYDSDGNIVSAFYGKISGAIEINWNNRLRFSYWLNTDPASRSLESTNPMFP